MSAQNVFTYILVSVPFVLCFFGFVLKRSGSSQQTEIEFSGNSRQLYFTCPRGDYSAPAPTYLPRTPLSCPHCGQLLSAR